MEEDVYRCINVKRTTHSSLISTFIFLFQFTSTYPLFLINTHFLNFHTHCQPKIPNHFILPPSWKRDQQGLHYVQINTPHVPQHSNSRNTKINYDLSKKIKTTINELYVSLCYLDKYQNQKKKTQTNCSHSFLLIAVYEN